EHFDSSSTPSRSGSAPRRSSPTSSIRSGGAARARPPTRPAGAGVAGEHRSAAPRSKGRGRGARLRGAITGDHEHPNDYLAGPDTDRGGGRPDGGPRLRPGDPGRRAPATADRRGHELLDRGTWGGEG